MKQIIFAILLFASTAGASATTWYAQPKVDAMTDKKSCTVRQSGAGLPQPLLLLEHGLPNFVIGLAGADYPGRPIMFRVDSQKAESAVEGFGGAQAARLLKQMTAPGAARLMVRGYVWPKDVPVNREFDLSGIAQAVEQCRSAMQ